MRDVTVIITTKSGRTIAGTMGELTTTMLSTFTTEDVISLRTEYGTTHVSAYRIESIEVRR